MTHDNSESQPVHYTLRPTFTPLLHNSEDRPHNSEDSHDASDLIRAANEDDDLYDPYSDFHDGTLCGAHFEEDPWR